MKSVDLALITATIACVFMVGIGYGDGKTENITAVKRRIVDNSDVYYYNVSKHATCKDNHTFMVEERECMKNEDLFKGKYIHNRYHELCTI